MKQQYCSIGSTAYTLWPSTCTVVSINRVGTINRGISARYEKDYRPMVHTQHALLHIADKGSFFVMVALDMRSVKPKEKSKLNILV